MISCEDEVFVAEALSLSRSPDAHHEREKFRLLCPHCQRRGARLLSAFAAVHLIDAQGRRQGKERRLIRLLSAGWVPHDQGSSRGCLCLAIERGLSCQHGLPTRHLLQTRVCEGSPPSTPCRPHWAPISRFVRPPLVLVAPCTCQTVLGASMTAAFGSTSRAIAQMKPTSSRATATIAFGAGLPAAISLR